MKRFMMHATLIAFATGLATIAANGQAMPGAIPPVPTTRILAMGHLTAGNTRASIAPVMKEEVPETLKLYLAGKIDQMFFRNDANGVVFLMNCSSVQEAHDILEKLPLGQHKMMEFDLIPLGPLAPLASLLPKKAEPAAK